MTETVSFIQILRLAALCISTFGYGAYFSRIMKTEFSQSFVFSGIACLMFLAGLANSLPAMAVIIFLGGFAALAISTRRGLKPKTMLTWGNIFFAVICVYFVFLLYGSEFQHWDNFSHWATAVRVMVENNRFPNSSDVNIEFKSYPLGTASLIYYGVFISGIKAEWLQMLIQSAAQAAMVLPLFAFAKKPETNILAVLASLMLLCANKAFTELLVDTILPLTAFAATAFIVYYRDDAEKRLLGIIPLLMLLVITKNSGLLFAILAYIYALVIYIRRKGRALPAIITAAAPAAALLLWQLHVRLTFSGGMESIHSMSVENYRSELAQKSAEDIRLIHQLIYNYTVRRANPFVWLAVLMLALLIIAVVFRRKNKACGCVISILVFSGTAYMIYQISLLGSYILSMPREEAIVIAAYYRYHQTILIFCGALIAVAAIMLCEELKGTISFRALSWSVCAVAALLLYKGVTPELEYYTRQSLDGTTRQLFDTLIAENSLENGKRCLIAGGTEEGDTKYYRYMAGYLLNPSQCDSCTLAELEDGTVNTDSYDYTIIFTEDGGQVICGS